jgi:hypothetical protein
VSELPAAQMALGAGGTRWQLADCLTISTILRRPVGRFAGKTQLPEVRRRDRDVVPIRQPASRAGCAPRCGGLQRRWRLRPACEVRRDALLGHDPSASDLSCRAEFTPQHQLLSSPVRPCEPQRSLHERDFLFHGKVPLPASTTVRRGERCRIHTRPLGGVGSQRNPPRDAAQTGPVRTF